MWQRRRTIWTHRASFGQGWVFSTLVTIFVFKNLSIFDIYVLVFLSVSPFLELSRHLGRRWSTGDRENETFVIFLVSSTVLACSSTFSRIHFATVRTKCMKVSGYERTRLLKMRPGTISRFFCLVCRPILRWVLNRLARSVWHGRAPSFVLCSRTQIQSGMCLKLYFPQLPRRTYVFRA